MKHSRSFLKNSLFVMLGIIAIVLLIKCNRQAMNCSTPKEMNKKSDMVTDYNIMRNKEDKKRSIRRRSDLSWKHYVAQLFNGIMCYDHIAEELSDKYIEEPLALT